MNERAEKEIASSFENTQDKLRSFDFAQDDGGEMTQKNSEKIGILRFALE